MNRHVALKAERGQAKHEATCQAWALHQSLAWHSGPWLPQQPTNFLFSTPTTDPSCLVPDGLRSWRRRELPTCSQGCTFRSVTAQHTATSREAEAPGPGTGSLAGSTGSPVEPTHHAPALSSALAEVDARSTSGLCGFSLSGGLLLLLSSLEGPCGSRWKVSGPAHPRARPPPLQDPCAPAARCSSYCGGTGVARSREGL